MSVTLPHDVQAIVDSLKLEIPDPALRRRISDAVAMLVQNNRAIEDGSGSFVTFPVLQADPASPQDGQAWVNSTLGKVRARVNGATVNLN